MRILYLGDDNGTSRHRADALVRLGHEVRLINPAQFLPVKKYMGIWIFKTGGLFLSGIVKRCVLKMTSGDSFDLVWVDSGVLIGPELVRALRKRFRAVINYNIDDPFGPRDGRRWRLYIRAVPIYDLIVVMRDVNVAEAERSGAKNVMRVFMSADEVANAPRSVSPEERVKLGSEVAFIGAWFPERGPFVLKLIQLGVPITIYGGRWHKAPEWQKLKRFWRGPGFYTDDGYAKAIQCAKICLGFVSKGNRDLHTQRSLEIPSLGSVLLAERTPEHLALYKEDEEAVFWSDAEECAAKCKTLLGDDEGRRRIAAAGRARCLRSGYLNEPVLLRILSRIQSVMGDAGRRQNQSRQ